MSTTNGVVFISQQGWEKLNEHITQLEEELLELRKTTAESVGTDAHDNPVAEQLVVQIESMQARLNAALNRKKRVTIFTPNGQHGTVQIGSNVTIQEEGLEPETYLVLGDGEGNPDQNIISYTSPLGSALMGKKKGEEAVLRIPDGASITIKIIDLK